MVNSCPNCKTELKVDTIEIPHNILMCTNCNYTIDNEVNIKGETMDNKNLFSAFIQAQMELRNPSKNKEAKMEKFSYRYTSLDKLIEETKPILAKYGLCVLQQLVGDGEKVGVKTILAHISGENLSEVLWVPKVDLRGGNLVQGMGAAITYARRYALASILGVASEEDTDANVEAEVEDLNPSRFTPPSFPKVTSTASTPMKTVATPAAAPEVKVDLKPLATEQKEEKTDPGTPVSKFTPPQRPTFGKPRFGDFVNKTK